MLYDNARIYLEGLLTLGRLGRDTQRVAIPNQSTTDISIYVYARSSLTTNLPGCEPGSANRLGVRLALISPYYPPCVQTK